MLYGKGPFIKLFIWLFIFVSTGFSFHVKAADTPVVQMQEPEGAVKGKVRLQAVIEPGYLPTIHAELVPDFEEGVVHEYVLSEGNGYELSDEIMEGTYGCVCYVDEKDMWKSDVTVTYGAGSKEVYAQAPEAVFVVIAGSPDYAEGNTWLSDYMSESGTYLKGFVSRNEIDELVGRLTAMQDGVETDYAEEEDINPPEEYVSPAVQEPEEEPEKEEKDADNEPEKEENGAQRSWAKAAAIIAAVIVLIALCRAAYGCMSLLRHGRGDN